MLVIEPTFQAHGWPSNIDLDYFNVSGFSIDPNLMTFTEYATG